MNETVFSSDASTTASGVVDSERSDPEERFMELYRAGRLAREFPSACALLNSLDDQGLTRAGRLLNRIDVDDVLHEHPSTPAVKVAITGHGTLNQLVPPLNAELARHGLLLRSALSDFDSYVFDLSDPDSALYRSAPDIVVCVLDPTIVFDELPVPWDATTAEHKLEEKVRLIEWLVERFVATTNATLVLNTVTLPRRFSAQLVDHRSRARLSAAWHRTNARLLELTERYSSALVIDLEPLLSEGLTAEDIRLNTYAKVPLSPALLARYAREVGHLARHSTGRTKKALALDMDNTLWGGILGDDGSEGIEVATSYRGEAFRAFQRVVKQLGSQGVLLTAVSKNDIEPVRRVLCENSDMALREDDFVRVTANWRPKPDNVRETAEALNIKPDSFVFVDDSSYECGLMRHALPEVTTVQIGTEPALHISRLLEDGWFDIRELTEEDRARPALYRGESERSDFLAEFESLADYLRELRVEVRIGTLRESDVNRVSQITLRTNQFNMTTVRMQPTEVREFAMSAGARVLTIHASDRFGDNGLVGALLVRQDDDTARIENFLLSCRVFSRGIEQACLGAVLRDAFSNGCKAVYGEYQPTAKNAGVADLYARYGFESVAGDDSGTTYRHDLHDIPAVPEHLHLIEDLQGSFQ
ncbi:HAD-IIIC family phosphatase [Haloactinomyces albus]|uniref:FkbH-like protein n=1 Tax=Haloactinomyces albus TaxID=1352928 RepID=A0AAE3ZHF0_9ACTN|nr:HAD-IIIC family phosphatase [Haloactinomyces albus]MDR7303668.1 FkbH-like protein [Haloactinomyces albus]